MPKKKFSSQALKKHIAKKRKGLFTNMNTKKMLQQLEREANRTAKQKK